MVGLGDLDCLGYMVRGELDGMLIFTRCEQGHICTLELTSGQVFRGKLIEGVFSFLCFSPAMSHAQDTDTCVLPHLQLKTT